MNLTKNTILIIIMIISLLILGSLRFLAITNRENSGIELYAKALEQYKNSDYKSSYYTFGKISSGSTLKPAAIYRQARACEHLGDRNGAIKKYKRLLARYPKFSLDIKSKYCLAQNLYELYGVKSEKSFKYIIKKYPQSEYAIASKYYLGLIFLKKMENEQTLENKEKFQKSAMEYFRDYLKDAYAGKFALSSIKQLKAINKLKPIDHVLFAKTYYALGDYNSAMKELYQISLNDAWVEMAKNAYELKDKNKVKTVVETGIANYNNGFDSEDIYKVIDLYLNSVESKTEGIRYLLSLNKNQVGTDYLMYLNCKTVGGEAQIACYNDLYNKYPEGQFAAESLYKLFYNQVQQHNYQTAKSYAKIHLKNFANVNSTPVVLFWMGKIYNREKNYELSRAYYKSVIEKYPDNYYAYKAYLNLNDKDYPLIFNDIKDKPVVFPYKNSREEDLVVKLALLKDYGLVSELCENDKFVQSWLAYQKGEFSQSMVVARDAMEKVYPKPDVNDLRWRLVYPVHYYDEIKNFSINNNPVLIMSLIREESYFNPKAQSGVGARGLMQLMPQTAKEVENDYGLNFFGENYLFDVDSNLKLGNLYYSNLKKRLENKDIFAILAYNGGIGSVQSWLSYLNYYDLDDFIEQIPYDETQNYLKKVLRSYWNYSRIYNNNSALQ